MAAVAMQSAAKPQVPHIHTHSAVQGCDLHAAQSLLSTHTGSGAALGTWWLLCSSPARGSSWCSARGHVLLTLSQGRFPPDLCWKSTFCHQMQTGHYLGVCFAKRHGKIHKRCCTVLKQVLDLPEAGFWSLCWYWIPSWDPLCFY